jgi:hypothetical protein
MLCSAQDPSEQARMQLELAQGNSENPYSLELNSEEMGILIVNPIKINFADADDLARLGVLDIFQISNLILYREKTGPIFTPYELMVVKGFDMELIEYLIPLLDFSTKPAIPGISWSDLRRSRHELVLRYSQTIQERVGFRSNTKDAYLGLPFGSYLRYRGQIKDMIHLGMAVQNDPGEPLGGRHNPALADHFSGFVSLTNYGPVEQFILGDYHVSYGQGIGFWTGGGFSGTGNFSRLKRYSQGARPYAGAEENRYLRGSALKVAIGNNLRVEAFISSKRIDARSETDTNGNITSNTGNLINTGLHRTESEIANKNVNRHSIYGGRLGWRIGQFAAKLYMVHHLWEKRIPPATDYYNRHRFSGLSLRNYGLELHYFRGQYNLFTELAMDHSGSSAFCAGLEALLADGFKLGAGFRNFGLRYQSFYTSPPAVRGTSGETGIYLGLDWEIAARCKLSLSIDRYQYTWISYRLDAPSEATNSMISVEFPISRILMLNLSGRIRQDVLNHPDEHRLNTIIHRRRYNLRWDLRYQVNQVCWFSWRVEKTWVQTRHATEGFMIYQDFGRQIAPANLDLVIRLAVVDVPDFQARIYAYESDLLYRFAIPAYFGKAFRTYVRAKWRIAERVSLEGKAALTKFFDRNQISSGLQAIEGSIVSDLSLQLRLKI